MSHFTKEEIEEIRRRLSMTAVKDSQFPTTENLSSADYVPILQDGQNKKVSIDAFATGFDEIYIDCGTSTTVID